MAGDVGPSPWHAHDWTITARFAPTLKARIKQTGKLVPPPQRALLTWFPARCLVMQSKAACWPFAGHASRCRQWILRYQIFLGHCPVYPVKIVSVFVSLLQALNILKHPLKHGLPQLSGITLSWRQIQLNATFFEAVKNHGMETQWIFICNCIGWARIVIVRKPTAQTFHAAISEFSFPAINNGAWCFGFAIYRRSASKSSCARSHKIFGPRISAHYDVVPVWTHRKSLAGSHRIAGFQRKWN